MPEPIRFALECRLCSFHQTVTVSSGIKPDMTQQDATAMVVEECTRAEEDFFRDHWSKAHPAEAGEIVHHISAVEKLAKVTSYHKRVLSARVEGPSGFREGGALPPTV
jgi:hypothetical protein